MDRKITKEVHRWFHSFPSTFIVWTMAARSNLTVARHDRRVKSITRACSHLCTPRHTRACRGACPWPEQWPPDVSSTKPRSCAECAEVTQPIRTGYSEAPLVQAGSKLHGKHGRREGGHGQVACRLCAICCQQDWAASDAGPVRAATAAVAVRLGGRDDADAVLCLYQISDAGC